MSSKNEIWIWAEQRQERIEPSSIELIEKGKELAELLSSSLAAVYIGGSGERIEELFEYGVPKVYLLHHPELVLYQGGPYSILFSRLVAKYQPQVILMSTTYLGLELAPRVAALTGAGLTAHCVDLFVERHKDGHILVQVVPGWGGNLMVKIVCPERRPQMATVKAGIFEKPQRRPGASGEVVSNPVRLDELDWRVKAIELIEEEEDRSLEEADVIVCGGWGVKGAGVMDDLQKLAETLKGAVAGTRPLVDAGLIAENQMIGISGKTVNPRLFISLGASGASHFTTGFLKSKVIFSIDQNPNAQIFEVSDLGIVGDLKKVLPVLVDELERYMQSRG
nr:electron transfer flavoprotein subunit alpha/FixB family protein [Desulfobacterales bacterium]